MATIKQRRAYKKMVENGGSVSKAMIAANYSPNTAKTPSKLTNTKGWKELLDKTISDRKLIKVLDEGLEAYKLEKGAVIGGEVGLASAEIQTPDFATRHKYLETGLKLKSRFPKELPENPLDGDLKVLLIQINNVITGQSGDSLKDLQIQ